MSAATLTRQERKRRKVARACERKAERCNLTPEEKRERRAAAPEGPTESGRRVAAPIRQFYSPAIHAAGLSSSPDR